MTENEQKIIKKISDLSGDYKCYDNRISRKESLVLDRLLTEVRQYRAIGTVEELQGQKEYIDTINEVFSGYSAIGTIEEFKALKEKSVAKKPNGIERKRDEYGFIYQIGKCPCCGKLVTDDRECCDCMQKLDWNE